MHPYWFVVASVALTLSTLVGYRTIVQARDEARFLNETEAIQDRMSARIDAYVSILLATQSLFVSHRGEVTLPKFRSFVSNLEIEERYPGIQGVGFSRRLHRTAIASALANVRRQGQAPLSLWPDHARDEYHAIVFLEPLDRRNRAALGYDMSTEKIRHEAMSRARDSGEPAASGKVTLVQEIDPRKQSGFLIYVPVYEGGTRPSDVASRRAELLGFVYSPFRVDDLMHGIFRSHRDPLVAFDLYDGTDPDPAQAIHRGLPDRARPARHSSEVRLEIAGRPWTLDVRSTRAFEAGSVGRFFPHLAIAAIFVNLACFFASRGQVRARREEAAIRDRLATLADASKRLSEAPLELEVVLETVCREVTPRLGESCTIHLIDASASQLSLARTVHAVAEAQQTMESVLRSTPIPLEGAILGRVARSGRSLFVPVIPLDTLLSSVMPQLRPLFDRYPIASISMIPMRVGERTIGTMTSTRSASWSPFTVEDEQLLQDVADRAASAIENARLAERLRDSMLEAQKAVRVRDEFLSIAGHELRTPLAALQLQVEGLLRQAEKGAFGPIQKRLVERMNKAHTHVERLELLIAGLLDVSRIAAGRLSLEYEEVDLTALLGDVVDRFAEHLSRAGCPVSLRAGQHVVGFWDRVRLDQVFTNLMSNALKYGSGKPIDVEITSDAENVEVDIRDRGIGISPEDRDRIFGRFERAVSDQNYGGLGLGLWISQQIVQALGGSIELESELGHGSTFTVRLPLRPKEQT